MPQTTLQQETAMQSAPPQNVLLAWTAPVMAAPERSTRWYIIGGTIVLIVAAYGILSGSWPLALVSILCGALYFLLRDHVPEGRTIAFNESGVYFDTSFTPWNGIASYWIIRTPQGGELHLRKRGSFTTDITIQLGNTQPDLVRSVLGQFATEDTTKREGTVDMFARYFKL